MDTLRCAAANSPNRIADNFDEPRCSAYVTTWSSFRDHLVASKLSDTSAGSPWRQRYESVFIAWDLWFLRRQTFGACRCTRTRGVASRCSSGGRVTWQRTGWMRFDSRQRHEFVVHIDSRLAVGRTRSPVKGVPRTRGLGVCCCSTCI
jgi:hypothetical protein